MTRMTRTHAAAPRLLAALVPLLLLGACATAPTRSSAQLAGHMAEQAEAQIALAKRQDDQDRERYDDRAVYQALIEKMQQQGLHYAALAHLDAYAQRFGSTDRLRMMRADALRETGQDEEAAALYKTLLDSKYAARAHQGLGLLAGARGDFEAAVAAFRAGLARDPVDASIANDLGYALMQAGELREARVPVMQALQLERGNARIVSNAAVWMLASGQRDEAMALMDAAQLPDTARQAVTREASRVARRAGKTRGAR